MFALKARVLTVTFELESALEHYIEPATVTTEEEITEFVMTLLSKAHGLIYAIFLV